MKFPSIVKYSREKLGMSQEEMAHALKISFATINRWENGKTYPNKMALSVFCDFCEKRGIKAQEMLQDDNQGE
ncbi:transcriptional repressor DicA [compost metagenome]